MREYTPLVLKTSIKRADFFLNRSLYKIEELKNPITDGNRGCLIVIANSVPKSGTNLIKTLLDNLPVLNRCRDYHLDMRCRDIARQIDHIRSGQFVTSHIPYDPRLSARIAESRVKNIFVIISERPLKPEAINSPMIFSESP